MNGESMIFLLIMIFTAGFMIGIGVYQLKSKKPVGFYSGEKPLKESELTSVRDWNLRHALMWIFYGVIIIVTSVIAAIMFNSVWSVIPAIGGVIFPLPMMIFYHHYLIRKYKIK